MAKCERCGNEHPELIGTNGVECCICKELHSCPKHKTCGRHSCLLVYRRRKRANFLRKSKDDAMRSLGLVKVKGCLGGTYWE